MSEPAIQVVSYPKRPKRVVVEDFQDVCPDVSLECASSSRRESLKANTSISSEIIELDREVNLFVNVFVDKEKGKNGRFMTLLRDEPFDKLRLEFAKELKCNQLDVMIHVNNVDAGPGDTPDSMGLDVDKLHVVNVFSLNPNSNTDEDLSSDPSFIPVKCIFASGRPRCVCIKLAETFAEAKKRIKKTLHLAADVEKLVFDNDVLDDSDTPESLDMEAEDVVEVHIKKT
ncbi:hypothetical protein OESDEN_07360 [Oesophagostomum dentatum]|uniref:Ubiquitin-like domain-containing protein n=1 Tax=Oesophagostomum dentatum TaxID=61180 RepID=A0A0B1TBM5_OESDE|nr:hypothetical protein OESDEN_07360 [Oesophagostomum dentatum]